jgi:hypothetical protein
MPAANANPDRRFFIDLITRDISLEDAVLDLIDNGIDSLVRTRHIDLYRSFLDVQEHPEGQSLAQIRVSFSPRQFRIEDNCGGIPFESAENEAFRFGHPDPRRGAFLSVFGIGMKRAIFKIGRRIEIESHASTSGFLMQLDVKEWSSDDSIDWKLPLEPKGGEMDVARAGTKIVITQLREEVSVLAENPTFQNRLIRLIQETYPFYLGKYVRIFVNKNEVKAEDLAFGQSEHIKPTMETWRDGGVSATLICGLLPRDDGKWTFEKSGWYILCNGRVIVHADKGKLTGWGGLLPQFMPKNRGFLGIVFFKSDHPEELPWKTTKRDINTESAVYIRTLKRMTGAARLVIQVQNKLYEGGDAEEPKGEYRDSVKELLTSSATRQAAERGLTVGPSEPQRFLFAPQVLRPKTTSIQFKVKTEDLARVKKRLGRTSMSNREVGERIFKYFLDRECSQ